MTPARWCIGSYPLHIMLVNLTVFNSPVAIKHPRGGSISLTRERSMNQSSGARGDFLRDLAMNDYLHLVGEKLVSLRIS